MKRTSTSLTDAKVKSAKPKDKDYKLFDSEGLYLLVTKSGGKHWKLKYYFEGKEKKLSLGEYKLNSKGKQIGTPLATQSYKLEDGKEIELIGARTKRDDAKALLDKGIDPSEKKKKEAIAKTKEDALTQNTFRKIALQRLDEIKKDISESHYKRTLRGFENDAFKYIGDKPIEEVTTDDIEIILSRMKKRGVNDSARKLYFSINQTFKWAKNNRDENDRKYFTKANPANDIDLNEQLGKPTVTNYATLTADEDIRGLLAAIDGYKGEYTTKQALRFMSYTAVRTINIRYAEWSEIDFEAKRWNIPASKMKTKKELFVPLTDSAIKILEDMREYSGGYKYVFPSIKSKTAPMSDNTLLGAIRRLGFTKEEFTPHGFRAMFSTIAHEKSPFQSDVIETQLAHNVGNKTTKAYNRTEYPDERVELMQWWSNYLENLKAV